MKRTSSWLMALLAGSLWLVLGCGVAPAAPAAQAGGAAARTTATGIPHADPTATRDPSDNPPLEFRSQLNDAGGVTVSVTPVTLRAGAAAEFDMALNTHSVELKDDLLKAVVLRDDAGREYTPSAWDGAGPGGHHRSGKLTFGVLATSAQAVTLVVKNIAGVPERVFQWQLIPS